MVLVLFGVGVATENILQCAGDFDVCEAVLDFRHVDFQIGFLDYSRHLQVEVLAASCHFYTSALIFGKIDKVYVVVLGEFFVTQ